MSRASGPDLAPTTEIGAGPGVASVELRDIDAGYGRTPVLRGVNLAVAPGTVVALLGPNGAGKTTLLKTLAGLIRPSSGEVLLEGADVSARAPQERTRGGLCLIPEGRGVFPGLSVRDNLRLQVPPWAGVSDYEERAATIFPILGVRLRQLAGTLSGGQQQMLALSRAWNSQAKVVLLDEVSMGLAPIVVDEIFDALRGLAAAGTSLLIVEQYVDRVLDIATDAYLLEKGRIVLHGEAKEVDREALLSGYLGVNDIDPSNP